MLGLRRIGREGVFEKVTLKNGRVVVGGLSRHQHRSKVKQNLIQCWKIEREK